MPMSFPDMDSLIDAAEIHKFRKPYDVENEASYRTQLANHVQPIDLVESMEIRTGKGWDRFCDPDNLEMLVRSHNLTVDQIVDTLAASVLGDPMLAGMFRYLLAFGPPGRTAVLDSLAGAVDSTMPESLRALVPNVETVVPLLYDKLLLAFAD